MRIAKDSTYESRDMLLERIRRQKQTIKELIAERDNLKSRLDAMSLYRTEAAMLREQLRPYTREVMRAAHEKGDPVMRALFYEFPQDEKAWETDDEFLFGPDVLVAPVLSDGQRERTVYLPALPEQDAYWTDLYTGEKYSGGQIITVSAPLDTTPAFVRGGTLEELLDRVSAE